MQSDLKKKLLSNSYQNSINSQSDPSNNSAAINPMHSPVENNNDLEKQTETEIEIALPSFWTRVSIISHSFAPLYYIEITKAAINATNMSILANIGEDEAAAAAFISSTVVLYCVAFPAINFYLFNLLAKYQDQKETIIFYALLLNLFFGCLLGLISYFTGDFLQLIGTSPNIAAIVSDFYSTFAFALPAIFLFLAWQVISVATGNRKIAFISSTLAVLSAMMWTIFTCSLDTNLTSSAAKLIGGSYIAGYALGSLFYLSYFIFHRLLVLPSWEKFITHLSFLSEWVNKGSYAVGHISCELLSLILQSILVVAKMDCSTSDLAMIAVLNFWNLNTVTFAIAMGLATNDQMSKISATNAHADHHKQAYGNTGLRICIALNVAVFVMSMISPETLVRAAGVNRRDIDIDNNMLRVYFSIISIGLAANSRRDVLPGNLRANEIVKTPMMASFTAQAIGLVLQYSLGVLLGMRVLGLQLGYYGGLILGSLYLQCVWDRNSNPDIAKENREDHTKLAEADSFKGQLKEATQAIITFFQNPSASIKNCLPCLTK